MRLPKQWIANVAYAILGDTFSKWVKAKIEENHEKKAEKGNLMIDMDPEVHAAFQSSTAVSRKYLLSILSTFVSLWEPKRCAAISDL